MDLQKRFVVYRLEKITTLHSVVNALEEVSFGQVSNNFETEEEAFRAIIDHDLTWQAVVILPIIYIRD